MIRAAAALLAIVACASAAAQQLYRWTDEKGRVHITDTPPPAKARDVRTRDAGAPSAVTGQVPYELAVAMKEFPVVLYTSPSCTAPCAAARDALNRRGVPFKETQVWNPETIAELRRIAGRTEVPVLVVGTSVQSGFEQGSYDALLDAARYPKAGILPARSQSAPPPPEGYAAAGKPPAPKAAAKPAAEEPAPQGPYAPGAPPQRASQRPAPSK
jgi:glutaredoxin